MPMIFFQPEASIPDPGEGLTPQDLSLLREIERSQTDLVSIFHLGPQGIALVSEAAHLIFGEQYLSQSDARGLVARIAVCRDSIGRSFNEVVTASRRMPDGSFDLLMSLENMHGQFDTWEYNWSDLFPFSPDGRLPANSLSLRICRDRHLRELGYHFELIIEGGYIGLSGVKSIFMNFARDNQVNYLITHKITDPTSKERSTESGQIKIGRDRHGVMVAPNRRRRL